MAGSSFGNRIWSQTAVSADATGGVDAQDSAPATYCYVVTNVTVSVTTAGAAASTMTLRDGTTNTTLCTVECSSAKDGDLTLGAMIPHQSGRKWVYDGVAVAGAGEKLEWVASDAAIRGTFGHSGFRVLSSEVQ